MTRHLRPPQHPAAAPADVLHWECGVSTPKAYQLEKLAEVTDTIVPFFKRGRSMPRITEAECHFRPCAYGR